MFLLALVGMTTMLLIGTAFMSLASQQFNTARRDLATLKTLAMAEGGVNYAYWNQNSAPAADKLTDGNIIATLGNNLRALCPTSTPAPAWHLTPTGADTEGYVWISKYPATSPTGYQIVGLGKYRSTTNAVRVLFTGVGTSQPPTDPTTETLMFSHTLFCNSALSFASDCAIGGDTVVNGDLYMGNSGRFVKTGSPLAGGNVNVTGNLTMDGSALIEGTASVKGNINLQGGSAKILGIANGLGTFTLSNSGCLANNITVNGNATVGGSTLTGTLTTGGNFKNTGWGTAPACVNYAGTYTNSGTPSYNSISHHATVVPLPASTGGAVPMPNIDITKYKKLAYGKTINPTGSTYTVNNAAPQFSDSDVNLNGNVNFTGGPNVMTLPASMNWYINGNFTSNSNTTLNGTDVTLYVHGDVNIGGTFIFNATGKVMIVCDGTINIGGGYDFKNTNVVLMSKKAITIGRNKPIHAQVYCHNDAGTATFTANSPDMLGAVICDKAIFNGNGNTFNYVPPTYPFLPTDPGAGGTGNTKWTLSSWEELK